VADPLQPALDAIAADPASAAWWEDKVGRAVIFRYPHGEEVAGVVTSVNLRYVFVNFGKVHNESCDPSMLRLADG
jgi:hypothetical protein